MDYLLTSRLDTVLYLIWWRNVQWCVYVMIRKAGYNGYFFFMELLIFFIVSIFPQYEAMQTRRFTASRIELVASFLAMDTDSLYAFPRLRNSSSLPCFNKSLYPRWICIIMHSSNNQRLEEFVWWAFSIFSMSSVGAGSVTATSRHVARRSYSPVWAGRGSGILDCRPDGGFCGIISVALFLLVR